MSAKFHANLIYISSLFVPGGVNLSSSLIFLVSIGRHLSLQLCRKVFFADDK